MAAPIPKYGLFSPYTLLFHRTATGEHPSAFLKRAAILFERLVFVPEGLGPLDAPWNPMGGTRFVDSVFDGSSTQTRDDYRKLFLRIEDVWSDHEQFLASLGENSTHDLWHGERSDRFASWVDAQVQIDVQANRIGASLGDAFEQKKHYLGSLSLDFKLLVEAGLRSPEFTGLLTELHEQAALATLGTGPARADAIIRALPDLVLSDFGSLTWEQILVLRKSGFIDDFRRQLDAWAAIYTKSLSPADVQRDITGLVHDGMFALVGETRPNVALSVFSAVVGAVPSFGVLEPAKAVLGIGAEMKRRRKYGWLYFMQDVRRIQTGAA